jgi:hypothetical protein
LTSASSQACCQSWSPAVRRLLAFLCTKQDCQTAKGQLGSIQVDPCKLTCEQALRQPRAP